MNAVSHDLTGEFAAARLEASTLHKVRRHIIPFLALLYFAAFIDRVSISFAAAQMNRDLGLSPEVYGFGARLFFIGYCLFEVPSNLILYRVGARRWISTHHDLVVPGGRHHGFHARADGVLCIALSARGRRSRLLSGHRVLPRFLGAGGAPRTDDRRIHGGHPGVDGAGSNRSPARFCMSMGSSAWQAGAG